MESIVTPLSVSQWRAWLKKNGKTSSGVWLVYYKEGAGKPRLDYGDTVSEALCFGWVDGKIRRIDEQAYARWFTPRRKDSRWSSSNVARARQLISEGRMTEAGFAVFRPERVIVPSAQPKVLPPEIEKEFRADAATWEKFQAFSPGYRNLIIGWIAHAKKEETQRKRLQRVMEAASRGEKLGMV